MKHLMENKWLTQDSSFSIQEIQHTLINSHQHFPYFFGSYSHKSASQGHRDKAWSRKLYLCCIQTVEDHHCEALLEKGLNPAIRYPAEFRKGLSWTDPMSSFNIFEQAHKGHFHRFLSSLPPPVQMLSNLFSHRANSRFWGELVKWFIGQKLKCKCLNLGQIYKCSQATAYKFSNQCRKRVQGKEKRQFLFSDLVFQMGKKIQCF